MKHFTIIILSILYSVSIQAQQTVNSNCTRAMSDYQFRDFKAKVSRQFGDQNKLTWAQNTIRTNCLSAYQVAELTQLFSSDEARYEFALKAYPRTVDQHNFYDVYDSFSRFSVAFRLHDAIKDPGSAYHFPNPGNSDPVNTDTRFPNLRYPNYANYSGRKNCNYPIADQEFDRLVGDIRGVSSNTGSQMNQISSYCLSTAQAMKFASLIDHEGFRYNFLKSSYTHVYDIENYAAVNQLLTNSQYKNGILNMMRSGNSGNTSNNPGNSSNCRIDQAEFSRIYDRVKKASFDSEKKSTMQSILRSKNCFSSNQVKELVKLFSFSKSKMEMAKFAYDYTIDPQNYYVVADVFNFSSDKEALHRYIDSKR